MARETSKENQTSNAQQPKLSIKKDVETISAWIALIAMITVNALAQFGVLVHLDEHDPRAAVFAWFTPDRYVQLIWIPIYLLIAVWLIRMHNGKRKAKRFAQTPFTVLGLIFIATCLLSIAWIIAWSMRNYPAAVSLVLVETAAVWVLWFFARKHDQSMWGWAPFSLWGSWLIVESITDIARAITYYVSKDGAISVAAQALSTVVVTVLLLALACFVRLRENDWIIGLVCLWATVGIAIQLMDVSKITAVIIIVLSTVAAALMYIPWSRITPQLGAFSSQKDETSQQHNASDENITQ